MEPRRNLAEPGQELSLEDADAMSLSGASADDRVFAELLRLTPYAGTIARAILPFGSIGSDGTDPSHAGIVKASGSSDAKIRVYPFRAIVGPIGAGGDPLNSYRKIHSVVVAADSGANLFSELTLEPTVANNRWDLIWVKVSLNAVESTASRYVRDQTTEVVTLETLDVIIKDAYTLGVTKGTEATLPIYPTTPSDSGSDYYIPLAFVLLAHPFTGASPVIKYRIHEVAPVVSISRAMGAATLQPGKAQWDPNGALLTATTFLTSAYRPDVYLPPTMTGRESRIFAFNWEVTNKSPAINNIHLLDDSIDWRYRIFEWRAQVNHNAGSENFQWAVSGAGRVPTALGSLAGSPNNGWGFGQSFRDDGTAAFTPDVPGGVVAYLDTTTFPLLAIPVVLFVDMATGALKLSIQGASPNAVVLVVIDASGPFSAAA